MKNKLWAIYAVESWGCDCGDCTVDDEDEVVATFDSKKSAERYLEQSRLKRPTYLRQFKYRSLLAYYRNPYVKIYEPIPETHEPKVDWK